VKLHPIALTLAAAALGWVVYRRRRMGWRERALWLVAAAALVVYGIGLIHLPSAEKVIESIGTTLGKWTYLLVAAAAFLETGAFVGLVAPGETIVLLGGFVAGQGEISVVLLLALVWACAVAGDVTSYWAGRRLGRQFMLRHGPKVKITEERLERVEDFFARYGGRTIFFGRFVGLIRAIAPFIAGSSRLPFGRFLPYDIVGAGLWATYLVLLGYIFSKSLHQLLEFAKRGSLALAAVIVLVAGIVIAYRYLRVPDNRRKVEAWVDAQADKPVVGPVVRAARTTWRRALVPAGRLAARLAPGAYELQVMTLLAVGLVGGFAFGFLAWLVGDGHRFLVDARAFDVADALRSGAGIAIVKIVTVLGTAPLLAAVIAAAAIWLTTRHEGIDAVAVVVGGVLTFVAVHIAKPAIDRPRPPDPLASADTASYPSGHAAYAIAWVAVALVLSRLAPGRGARLGLVLAAIALAAAIGLSRVYLRVHYMSDVVGGWGLGFAVFAGAGLVALLVRRLRQNGRRRPA
jgi:membrane protein DedA with SNARE-associated domain/membrane-associated phospholipid phosphatase